MRYLVVGGNSGIGLTLLNMLQEQGHEVVALSRNSDNCPTGDLITHYQCDIESDAPSFPEISHPLDGLVYLPGTVNLKSLSQLKITDYLRDFHINFLGGVKTIKHYLPNLSNGTSSSIVLMSSVAARKGFPFHCSVGAAKGAIIGFTHSLASELAPKMRVNAIAPSLTDTPLTHSLLDSEEKKAGSGKRHPLSRVGKPEDIASMIAFLLSDNASWITGQIFGIDGGISTLAL